MIDQVSSGWPMRRRADIRGRLASRRSTSADFAAADAPTVGDPDETLWAERIDLASDAMVIRVRKS